MSLGRWIDQATVATKLMACSLPYHCITPLILWFNLIYRPRELSRVCVCHLALIMIRLAGRFHNL